MSVDQKHVKFTEESEFLALADKALGDALEDGLPTAAEYIRSFISMAEGSGLGLAKLLHGINVRWSDFEKEDGDNFHNWAVRSTGKAGATIQRRICAWEFLSGGYIPDAFKEGIEGFSIKMLTKAYRMAVRQERNKQVGNYNFVHLDYEVKNSDWLALSEAIDEVVVGEVVDRVTGKKPRSNRIKFKVDGRGQVWYYKGKDHGKVVGEAYVNSHDPTIREGAFELLDRAGVTEKDEV